MSEVFLSGWETLGMSFNFFDVSQILVYSWQWHKQQKNYPESGAAGLFEKSVIYKN